MEKQKIMELDYTSSYKKLDERKLLPTIETYSDALSDHIQKRRKAAIFLLVIYEKYENC